jgi:hypothetical protein
VTDDAIWPSISSAADETSARLDRLLASSAIQRSQNLQRLEHLVAGLGHSDVDSSGAPPERRERSEDRRPSPPDPAPFVALPTRTTHGGPWGPKMREKLTRIALEKAGW